MIKLALVDSGFNIEELGNSNDGWNGNFEDYRDNLGHGTKCANIIRSICHSIGLVNVKVFDKKLVTSPGILIDAIKWCIHNEIKIINLSVSINDVNYYYELKSICNEAVKKGIIVIASADNFGRPCLPAYFSNVFGVGIADLAGYEDFIFMEKPEIQLYTRGDNGGEILNKNHSTSYAAARMSGIIANIISVHPAISFSKLKEILKLKSNESQNDKILRQNQSFNFKKNTKPIQLSVNDNIIKNLGKVALLATAMEINQFKKYKAFLKIKIYDLIELKFKSPIDINNIYKKEEICLTLPSNLEYLLRRCDSLVLGMLPDKLYLQIIEIAKQIKIKVYTLYPIDENVLKQSKIKQNDGINSLQNDPKIKINELFDVSSQHITKSLIPILGIINLCQNREIFNVELLLKQELEANNYKIGQISSSSKADLFNFDYSFSDLKKIPYNLHSAYAKALVESVNNKKPDTDILLVGMDDAIVPNYVNSLDFFDVYSTPSISMMFGFQLDAAVVVIDELIDVDYIINNINCIKNLLCTEILFVINNSLFNRNDKKTIQTTNCDKMMQMYRLKINNLACELKRTEDLSIFEINEHTELIVKKIKEQLLLQVNS